MKTIECFFIGNRFYSESGTMMSSIYKISRERYDFGSMERDLSAGCNIMIRPASEDELQWAKSELRKWRRK